MVIEVWMGIAHGLAYVILGGFGWWLASLAGRVGRVEDRQNSVEQGMATYEGDIRVANVSLDAIKSTLDGHIFREEHETWSKIEVLGKEISEMRVNMATIITELKSIGEATRTALKHVSDHDKEADGWKHRIVGLEAEAKKNGTK